MVRSRARPACVLADLIDDFTGYLTVERGASPNTVAAYRRDLQLYAGFLARTAG